MDLVDVDPRDERCFAAWFAVLDAVDQHLRPGEVGRLLAEERYAALEGQRPQADDAHELFAVRDGNRVMGAARMVMPQLDNRHAAEVLLEVLPGERRRGVGRLLAAELDRRARAHGRDTLMAYADEPPVGEAGTVVRNAAAALGWEVAQVDVRRDLDLPLDPARCARLEASASRTPSATTSAPGGTARRTSCWTTVRGWTGLLRRRPQGRARLAGGGLGRRTVAPQRGASRGHGQDLADRWCGAPADRALVGFTEVGLSRSTADAPTSRGPWWTARTAATGWDCC
jgi:GNAT superfamily N-acetyltransferase